MSAGSISFHAVRAVTLVLAVCFAPFVASAPYAKAQSSGAVGPLLRLLESGRVPAERQGAIVEMICTRGGPDELSVVFQRLQQPGAFSPALRLKVIDLLTDAAVTRKVKPAGDLKPLSALLSAPQAAKDPDFQRALIRLASAWQLSGIAEELKKIATSDSASPELRQSAIEGLGTIGGKEALPTIRQLAAAENPLRVRILAVTSLARIDLDAAIEQAAHVLAGVKTGDDPSPMLDAILNRQGGAEKLAAVLNGKAIPADAAKMALRHMYSVGRSDQALSDVLSKAAGIALDSEPPMQEEVAKIAAEVVAKGDPARGERIFRRSDLSCIKCHSVSQAGGSVGPELSAVGSISPVDYIVNSILNPNLAIKEQYVTLKILTLSGQVFTGILIDRDDKLLRLRDANSNVVTIPIDEIDQEAEGKSLMPQGLTKFLTHEEFLDLARFVSELGKPGPYAIRKSPGIQRWRVLKSPGKELTSEVPNVEILREMVLDAPPAAWNTAYAMVGGELPLDELRPADTSAVLYLQGQIEVLEGGKISVSVSATAPTHVWIDAEPFESQKQIERELPPGKHTITLRVEAPPQAGGTVKVDVLRPEGSAAQFVVLNGT